MKRKHIRIVICTLCFSMFFAVTSTFADSNSVEMFVNEKNIIKHIDRHMYGINYEWGGTEPRSMICKEGTTEINPQYTKVFDGCLPMGRAAGMSANRLYWKGAIGNLEDRTLQKFWHFAPRKQTVGPIEWFKANMSVEQDTKFIYTVNLYDTQENIADLVEFLCGDGTINYNGGVDWAAKRKSLGIEQPINIMAFELANEIDAGSEGAWNINKYLDACRRTIKTIRSVKPDAKIAVMKQTSGGDTWMNWHRALLSEIGDQIDYIAAHTYYRGFDDIVGYVKSAKTIQADILNITGSDRIKILYTEQAGKGTSDVYDSVGYREPHTMKGVLETAEWYVRAASMPIIEASAYHTLISANWSVVYFNNGVLCRSAIGDLLRVCTTYFTGDALETSVTNYSYDVEGKAEEILGTAVKTSEGINLFLVNQSEEECNYNIRFSDGYYKPIHKAEISASSLTSDNYKQWNEISYTEEDIENGQYLTSYTVNPLSVTVLKLVPCENDENAKFTQKTNSIIALSPDNNMCYTKGINESLKLAPLLYNDKMYIPLTTAEVLFGASITVDSSLSEAYFSTVNGDYRLVKDADSYYKNDTVIESNKALIGLNDNLYVLIRDIADAYNYTVCWDDRGFVALQDKVYKPLNSNDDRDVLDFVYNKIN